MKVIICGPRDFDDYESLKIAIEKSGFKISQVVSGVADGADKLGERWAEENGVKIKQFSPDWNNLTQEGAVVKENKWKKLYNVNAGFFRNSEMVEYCDACIAINTGSKGTGDTIKKIKKAGKPIFEFNPHSDLDEEDYEYTF